MTIKSNRYKDIGEIGKGTWGTVHAAEDLLTGARVAIKTLTPTELAETQMEHRGLDSSDILRREAGFGAARHVVPRLFNLDEAGVPFIVMPLYMNDLAKVLREENSKETRNGIIRGYPSKEEGLRYISDILTGMGEMHTVYHSTYGDWKPDNVVVDDSHRAVLVDCGTSSCLSIGRQSSSPRDNMGFIQTRAPERFLPGSHPTISSDVYGATSLGFRIHTGEYPLEDILERIILGSESYNDVEKRVSDFFQSTGRKGIEKLLKERLDLVPKEFRSFYFNGLRFNPKDRFADAEIALREFRKSMERSTLEYKLKDALRKQMSFFGIPLILLGILGVGGFLKKYNTNIPERPPILGPIQSGNSVTGRTQFESESLDLPPTLLGPEYKRDLELNSALLMSDTNTGYFVAQYQRAYDSLGGDSSGIPFLTPLQFQIWSAYSSPAEKTGSTGSFPGDKLAKNLAIAFNQARLPNGNIDLEDTCAIGRVGLDVVNLAKRASGSFNFREYISAKDSAGNYIVPSREQYFIKTWISYIHENSNKTNNSQ